MGPSRHFQYLPPLFRGRRLVIGSAVILAVLSVGDCRAQQAQRPQAGGNVVPTLEALPHEALPPGQFLDWCADKLVMEVDRKKEIYNGSLKASPLSFPSQSQLDCGDDGQKLAFDDQEAGYVYGVDIAGGVVERTLATYDKKLSPEVVFSPDLKNVASNGPLTLGPNAVGLNVVALGGTGRRNIGNIRWSPDSTKLFGMTAPEGVARRHAVEIVDTHRRKIGSGMLPPGFDFRDGWFANAQALYLLANRDESGPDVVFRCRIENWKCDRVAQNVLAASVGGDGILAMVLALGKYSNDGEIVTYPSRFAVEIRNGASQLVARQVFKSSERAVQNVSVTPSGTRAVVVWRESWASRCPPGEEDSERCRVGIYGGMVVDLLARPK